MSSQAAKKRKTTSESPIENAAHRVTPCNGYDVAVGQDFLHLVPKDVLHLTNATTFVIITDDHIKRLYQRQFNDAFTGLKTTLGVTVRVLWYSVPPGEDAKCRAIKAAIEDWMLSQGCDRSTVVVAFGGGVVGDLGGFVAATYMRGVKFIQVPTTLLAMNDSSIGGKTGIDTPAGKNLVGAFHKPVRVYIDVSLLKTLPQREMSNGMAEVIKHAAIRNGRMFSELQTNAELIMSKDPASLLSIIHQSVVIKTTVVIEDEKEGGLRAILNFGHSVGHGIEAIMAPGWLHGECVSVGMIKETEIARGRGNLAPDALGRLLSCLQAYNLPVKMPAEAHPTEVLRRMACDKKNKFGKKYIVMLSSIGDGGNCAHPIADDDILRVMSPGIELVPSGPLRGSIKVPGSKSISNRVLLMAALGRGPCVIKGLLHSDDTLVMMDALQALGVSKFEWKDGGKTLIVTGVDGKLKAPSTGTEIYLGNAGTASRFLTSSVILAAGDTVHLTGNKRMKERPIGPLVDALRQVGCIVDYLGTEGCLPLNVGCGGFPGGTVNLSATISSQYVSSVLIAAPYAAKPTRLQLNGKAVSPTYIDMTISLMKIYGVDVGWEGEGTYIIPNCGYTNPAEMIVESDASSASYPLALAAITGGNVTVDGIGTMSLQGDAKFCEVLRKMGCRVEQTETKTTVNGPPVGSLKPIVVDMESVTDTFMTAAAVMATAQGTSRIYNIANQRVKECDRIAAMVAELRKCGVVARELPDGLEIDGVAKAPVLAKPAEIHCYKDHRIAMSFGVLGSAWPSIQITDKDCTDKTFPSFWHDLALVFGIEQLPWNVPKKMIRCFDKQSAFIIGMRAAGKTTLGKNCASFYSSNFIDLDEQIDDIQGIVKREGWPAFRAKETLVLKEVIKKVSQDASSWIISCGGGIVESNENQALLKKCGFPVVWVKRPIAEIESFLNKDGSRPAYGENIIDVFKRRVPKYAACSTTEFCPVNADSLSSVQENFNILMGQILGHTTPSLRGESQVASFTIPNVASVDPSILAAASADRQAVELRVDLLHSLDADNIHHQVQLIRRICRKPVIFCLLPESCGGSFKGSEREYWDTLDTGLRAGCEYIEVQVSFTASNVAKFLDKRKQSYVIVASYRQHKCASTQDFYEVCRQCSCAGRADVIKVVFAAESTDDNFLVHDCATNLESRTGISLPIITLLTGPSGMLSHILNRFMTPVTHPTLPSSASYVCTTGLQLKDLRSTLGLIAPYKYFIFGTPVSASPSPCLHNAAFAALGLPHTYHRLETNDIEIAMKTLEEIDTGGASVTIPLKEDMYKRMDELTPAARTIGAVNTVIVERNRGGKHFFIGHNTDWNGIVVPILKKCPEGCTGSTALIVGAGGTSRAVAYGLKRLGCSRVIIYNRTYERAQRVADSLGCEASKDLTNLPALSIVVSTLPAKVGFTLPEEIVKTKPLVFDVNYNPAVTSLMAQAARGGCKVIGGLEMLIEQGLEQHRVWLQVQSAPADAVRKAVYAEYRPQTVP